jgi:hypothetical protein
MKKLTGRIALVVWLLAAVLLTGVSPVSAEATSGFYVRKNENGCVNAQMNVIVLPNIGPVISVSACDYQGNEELMAEGWHARPVIRLGGTIQAMQRGYGARLVIGARVLPQPGEAAITESIPARELPSYEAVMEPRRIILKPMSQAKTSPDIAGVYEFAGMTPSPDGFKAFALLEWLPGKDIGFNPWTEDCRYEITELDGVENRATDLYPALGKDFGGYAINVFDGADGSLRNSFVVTYFLEAVYRVTPDGQAALIFRAAEPKG